MTSTASSSPIGGRTRLLTAPAVAGVAYLAAWVTGLAVWPSNLDVAASGSQVVAAYTGHQGVAMTQSLLFHGMAAVALALVVLALGQAARRRHGGPLGPAMVVAGVGAVAVSLVQCALGLLLAGSAVPDGDSSRAGSLFAAINRLDGVKMFALAAMAASGAALVRRTRLLPMWLGYLGALLAVALVVSGIGYLLLSSTLAPTAYVSGLLLLAWVTAAGISLGGLQERQWAAPGRKGGLHQPRQLARSPVTRTQPEASRSCGLSSWTRTATKSHKSGSGERSATGGRTLPPERLRPARRSAREDHGYEEDR